MTGLDLSLFEWVMWGLLVVMLVARLMGKGACPLSMARPPQESPLDALKRRYAEGEITTEEYEKRRHLLMEPGARTA